jgi:hypothetical protein
MMEQTKHGISHEDDNKLNKKLHEDDVSVYAKKVDFSSPEHNYNYKVQRGKI